MQTTSVSSWHKIGNWYWVNVATLSHGSALRSNTKKLRLEVDSIVGMIVMSIWRQHIFRTQLFLCRVHHKMWKMLLPNVTIMLKLSPSLSRYRFFLPLSLSLSTSITQSFNQLVKNPKQIKLADEMACQNGCTKIANDKKLFVQIPSRIFLLWKW